jgi:hypothetical protein
MRNSIKRLYEADDIQQMPMNNQMPLAPQMMQPPSHAASSAEMMPDINFQDDQEQENDYTQHTLPQADVMTLSVQELIDRCNKINPLICMGLQQFIESNREELLDMKTGEAPEEGDELKGDDINFSKQMEPQAPQFSLDQPETDLEFPQG